LAVVGDRSLFVTFVVLQTSGITDKFRIICWNNARKKCIW